MSQSSRLFSTVYFRTILFAVFALALQITHFQSQALAQFEDSPCADADSKCAQDILLAEDSRDPASQVLVNGLTSDDPIERELVARAYGQIVDVGSIDPLLKLITDSNPKVVHAALFGLGQLGIDATLLNDRAQEIIQKITAQLSAYRTKNKGIAVQAIAKILRADHMDTFLPFFDPSSGVSPHALALALGFYMNNSYYVGGSYKYATYTDSVLKGLIQMIQSGSHSVRKAALIPFSLNGTGAVQARAAIEGVANDRDPEVRQYALTALRRIKDQGSLSVFVAALNDSNLQVRKLAIKGLVALGAQGKIRASLAQDSSAIVRSAYVAATNTVLAADPSAQVRNASILALNANPPSDPNAILAFVKKLQNDPSASVRATLLNTISLLPAPLPALTPFLNDPAVLTQSAAAQTISNLNTTDVIPVLEGVVASSNEISVRTVAFNGLINNPNYFQTIPWMLGVYRASKDLKWIALKNALFAQFVAVQGDDANAALKEMAQDPDADVAFQAWTELQNRGVPNIGVQTLPPNVLVPEGLDTFDEDPILLFSTSKGDFVMELYPDEAPVQVAHMVKNARTGVFNNTIWHRVDTNYNLVQGGDPDHSGWGGFPPFLRTRIGEHTYQRGTVGAPRFGWDTDGTQFFITTMPEALFNFRFSSFGQVVEGLDVLDQLDPADTIFSVTVLDSWASARPRVKKRHQNK